MSIEIHKPELVQRLTAHIHAGHFHDADELIEKALDALDEHTAATSPWPGLALYQSDQPVEDRDSRPIWEVILDNMKDVPAEDLAALPKDGASQVDHYIYGVPKRNQ